MADYPSRGFLGALLNMGNYGNNSCNSRPKSVREYGRGGTRKFARKASLAEDLAEAAPRA